MRVGVIGAGFIAAQHVRAWQHLGVEPVLHGGSGGPSLGAATGAEVAESFERMLESVDVVDLCVPTDLHVDYAVRSAEAGRHVICEKPLALTEAEAGRALEACERAGVRLFVSQVVRYFAEYRAASDAVAEGAVGEVAVIRLARESFLPQRSGDHWLFDDERSGGIIGDLMSHDIDYAISLAGPVTRVFARTMRASSSVVDDHAYLVLTHGSGALSHLTGSWAHVAPRFRTRIDIAGSAGLLTFDSDAARTLGVDLHGDPAVTAEVGLPEGARAVSDGNPFVRQLRDFVDAIEGDATARVDPRDALGVASVIDAARQSARTRRAVSIP